MIVVLSSATNWLLMQQLALTACQLPLPLLTTSYLWALLVVPSARIAAATSAGGFFRPRSLGPSCSPEGCALSQGHGCAALLWLLLLHGGVAAVAAVIITAVVVRLVCCLRCLTSCRKTNSGCCLAGPAIDIGTVIVVDPSFGFLPVLLSHQVRTVDVFVAHGAEEVTKILVGMSR